MSCKYDLHGHVLLLGKDSIVGLELVLLEVLGALGRTNLDVELHRQLIRHSKNKTKLTKGLPIDRTSGLDIVVVRLYRLK